MLTTCLNVFGVSKIGQLNLMNTILLLFVLFASSVSQSVILTSYLNILGSCKLEHKAD